MNEGRACGVVLDQEQMEADAVVVCLGAWSRDFLRKAGIDPHIIPARGYSITLPPGEAAPEVSVTAQKVISKPKNSPASAAQRSAGAGGSWSGLRRRQPTTARTTHRCGAASGR